MSAANITNHLTAVRSLLIIYNRDVSAFRDHRIFLKSVKINKTINLVFKTVIDEDISLFVVLACEHFHHPVVFKASYVFAYFSFLGL